MCWNTFVKHSHTFSPTPLQKKKKIQNVCFDIFYVMNHQEYYGVFIKSVFK